MSKSVKSIIAGLVLSVISTGALAASTEVLDASKAVVQIGDYCSGTIVKSERDFKTGKMDTVVLTAKHCVEGSVGSIVPVNIDQYQNNRRVKIDSYIGEIAGKSYKSDLAIVRLKDKETAFMNTNVVAKSDTKLEWGDDVLTIGYPLGYSKTLTYGTLGFVEDWKDADFSQSGEFYRATPQVAPGSSGSALLKLIDGKYQIVGVLTAAAGRGSTHVALYTPVEEVNEYLDVVLKPAEKTEKVGK